MENQKKKRNSSNSMNKKVTFNSTKSNIKILKVTDLCKDIYSTQTGKTLSVLKSNKNQVKQNSLQNKELEKDRK